MIGLNENILQIKINRYVELLDMKKAYIHYKIYLHYLKKLIR